MDIAELIGGIVAFTKANPLIALVVGAIILFVFYRRPGLSSFLLLIVILLTIVYYMIMSMSSSAVSEKERLLNKSTAPEETVTIDPRVLR